MTESVWSPASTTSPRLKVIVDVHFRSVPVLGGGAKTPADFGRLFLADAARPQVNGALGWQEGHNHAGLFEPRRRLEQFHLAVPENTWHACHHGKFPEWCSQW